MTSPKSNLITADYQFDAQNFDPSRDPSKVGVGYNPITKEWSASTGELVFPEPVRGLNPSWASGLLSDFRARVIANAGTVSDYTLSLIQKPLDTFLKTSAAAKVKYLWLPVGDQAAAGLIPLIKPSAITGIMTVTGGVTYNPVTGFTGNGTTGFLTSNFNPDTQGFSLGEQGFSVYIKSGGNTGMITDSQIPGVGYNNSGVAGGSSVGQTFWLGESAVLSSQMCNSSYLLLSPDPQGRVMTPFGRLLSVQVSALSGVQSVEERRGAYVVARAPVSLGALTQSTGNIQLFATNGASFSAATIQGCAYYAALTDQEFVDLNTFFDAVNISLGRGINPIMVCSGDSIIAGSVLASPTTQRWSALVAQRFNLTEWNIGVGGARFYPATTGNMALQGQGFVVGQNGAKAHIAYGINDVGNANGNVVTLNAAVETLRAALDQLRTNGDVMDNIMVVGPAAVNAPVMIANYPSYAGYRLSDHLWFNAALKGVTERYGARFVDLVTPGASTYADAINSTPSATYLSDGIHPNVAGNVLIFNDVVAGWLRD